MKSCERSSTTQEHYKIQRACLELFVKQYTSLKNKQDSEKYYICKTEIEPQINHIARQIANILSEYPGIIKGK